VQLGSFTIDPGATLLISGTATKTLNRYNFVNAGNATWLGTGGIGQSNGNQSSFTNSGTLTLGSPTGAANMAVNFIQTANATLNVRIASASVFDTLNITGSATLAGKVNVDLLGEFVPASGNLFQILSATSITGTFASVTGEGLFTAVPNSNNVTLLAS
jgi:hypothetical protein